ncbi:FG-GAP-like repeat-containing protein [Streptosporangium soli]|nr:FG-GAP-like repeat-containing protein [Streptosporangium sp. KLBMP 9127]
MRMIAALMLICSLAACDARPTPVDPCAKAGASDFDGDGRDDVLISASRFDQDWEDAVYLLTAGKLVPLPRPGRGQDGFGAALKLAKVNGDGCADAIIGAPTADADDQLRETGAVYVLYGRGVAPPAKLLAPTPQTGSRFGSALALHGDLIAIGAPYEQVSAVAYAGAAYLARGGAVLRAITQDSPGVPDVSEEGDRFGSAVALGTLSGGRVGLLVGAPGEQAASTTTDPGMVTVLPDAEAATLTGSTLPGAADGRQFGRGLAVVDGIGFAASSMTGDLRLFDPARKPIRQLRFLGGGKGGAADGALDVAADGRVAAHWAGRPTLIFSLTDSSGDRQVPGTGAMDGPVTWTGSRLAVSHPSAYPDGWVSLVDPATGPTQQVRQSQGQSFGRAVAG